MQDMTSTTNDLRGERGPWSAVISVLFGNLAITVPPMIIYFALPDMMRAFSVGENRIQWVATALQIASAGTMMMTTWLVRRFGQRAVYVASALLLIAGSVVGALADTLWVAVAGRVMQGAAGGIIPALTMVTIVSVLPARHLGLGMTIWGVGFAITAVITPIVGGLLVEAFGWRSVFLAVIPIILPGLLLGMRYLPRRDAADRAGAFDWLGLALLFAPIACLLYLPTIGALYGWSSLPAIVCMSTCVLGFVLLVAWQLKARDPLFDIGLFRNRKFNASFVVALSYDVGMYGTLYLVPLYMQTVAGYSPSLSGSLITWSGLAFLGLMMVSGPLCNILPSHRVVFLGVSMFAVSCWMLTRTAPSTSYAFLLVALILSRAGAGTLLPSLNVLTVRVTEPPQHAAASVTLNFARIFGGAVGSFALALFYDWRSLVHQAALGLPATRDLAGLTGEALGQWQLAKTYAIRESFWLMTAMFAVTLIPAWLTRETEGTEAAAVAQPADA
jgi:EmrB/QacA subfamily drug resistance transporter